MSFLYTRNELSPKIWEESRNEPWILVSGDVSLRHCSNGSRRPVLYSLRENIKRRGDGNYDLCDSGCSDIFVRLPGRGACTTGMVLTRSNSEY